MERVWDELTHRCFLRGGGRSRGGDNERPAGEVSHHVARGKAKADDHGYHTEVAASIYRTGWVSKPFGSCSCQIFEPSTRSTPLRGACMRRPAFLRTAFVLLACV